MHLFARTVSCQGTAALAMRCSVDIHRNNAPLYSAELLNIATEYFGRRSFRRSNPSGMDKPLLSRAATFWGPAASAAMRRGRAERSSRSNITSLQISCSNIRHARWHAECGVSGRISIMYVFISLSLSQSRRIGLHVGIRIRSAFVWLEAVFESLLQRHQYRTTGTTGVHQVTFPILS